VLTSAVSQVWRPVGMGGGLGCQGAYGRLHLRQRNKGSWLPAHPSIAGREMTRGARRRWRGEGRASAGPDRGQADHRARLGSIRKFDSGLRTANHCLPSALERVNQGAWRLRFFSKGLLRRLRSGAEVVGPLGRPGGLPQKLSPTTQGDWSSYWCGPLYTSQVAWAASPAPADSRSPSPRVLDFANGKT